MAIQTNGKSSTGTSGVLALAWLLATVSFAAPWPAYAGEHAVLVVRDDGVTVTFQVEIAGTAAERAQGLMQRAALDARTGMLFDFGHETAIRMWMKDTLIPLDMLFVGEGGGIRYIAANTVPYSEALIVAPEPARYVLEINAGEAARFGLQAGDTLVLRRR